jgi:hypothetical protein
MRSYYCPLSSHNLSFQFLVRFDAFKAVKIHIAVCWVVVLCCLVWTTGFQRRQSSSTLKIEAERWYLHARPHRTIAQKTKLWIYLQVCKSFSKFVCSLLRELIIDEILDDILSVFFGSLLWFGDILSLSHTYIFFYIPHHIIFHLLYLLVLIVLSTHNYRDFCRSHWLMHYSRIFLCLMAHFGAALTWHTWWLESKSCIWLMKKQVFEYIPECLAHMCTQLLRFVAIH